MKSNGASTIGASGGIGRPGKPSAWRRPTVSKIAASVSSCAFAAAARAANALFTSG